MSMLRYRCRSLTRAMKLNAACGHAAWPSHVCHISPHVSTSTSSPTSTCGMPSHRQRRLETMVDHGRRMEAQSGVTHCDWIPDPGQNCAGIPACWRAPRGPHEPHLNINVWERDGSWPLAVPCFPSQSSPPLSRLC